MTRRPPRSRSTKKSGSTSSRTNEDKQLSPLDREREDIVGYVESQGRERVRHAEKAASERVGHARYEIWDVHCARSRWWVITNPTNLYSQKDFKSRDVALSFHIGLMTRVIHQNERSVPLAPSAAKRLPGSWRRWEQAFESYDSGDEAENFQAVGVRLRECLISFIDETRNDALVPAGQAAPKNGDVKAWTDLLANKLAAGAASASLRSYLKKNAFETWEYVNWLTHAKNAVRLDAAIGLRAVEHLLGVFTAARLRAEDIVGRCAECASYMNGRSCGHCGWADPNYRAPKVRRWSKAERERRLAEPCILSSDISAFISPRDVGR